MNTSSLESVFFSSAPLPLTKTISQAITRTTPVRIAVRKDYHYAKVLPLAITAASEVYNSEEYITEAARFASRIIANCDQEDWVLRYFAAETYVELAGRTKDDSYLQLAYDIAINNVNYLSRKQVANNQEFLAEIKPAEIPAGATSSKKKEIETYNKGQSEARKVAVPPVSEALILNADLLFSLAKQMNIGELDQSKITGILYGHGSALFLNPLMNGLYSFDAKESIDSASIDVSFDGKEIKIPARYLTENTMISVGGLDTSGKMFSINGWTIKSVERKNKADIETFIATLNSQEASSFKYSEGSTVWINLNSYGDSHERHIGTETVKNLAYDYLCSYLDCIKDDLSDYIPDVDFWVEVNMQDFDEHEYYSVCFLTENTDSGKYENTYQLMISAYTGSLIQLLDIKQMTAD